MTVILVIPVSLSLSLSLSLFLCLSLSLSLSLYPFLSLCLLRSIIVLSIILHAPLLPGIFGSGHFPIQLSLDGGLTRYLFQALPADCSPVL